MLFLLAHVIVTLNKLNRGLSLVFSLNHFVGEQSITLFFQLVTTFVLSAFFLNERAVLPPMVQRKKLYGIEKYDDASLTTRA
jgi:hypothetical protein